MMYRITRLVTLIFLTIVVAGIATAQERRMTLSGEILSPAYEGWWPNEDGSYKLFFGYMNSNWEEEFDIEVGQENYFSIVEPGELDDINVDGYDFGQADRGQPTHFYPRRNPFLFTIDVPADFGEKELIWTLQSRSNYSSRAYGTLKSDYRIDPQVISTEVGGAFGSLDDRLRTNIPPELTLEGEAFRTVRVGEALDLAVTVTDPDNLPARTNRPDPRTPEQIYRPPNSIVVMSGPGERFSWTIYRGPADRAKFEPVQRKTYMDSRVYGNSPWSPPYTVPEPPEDNRWTSTITFDTPGEYVLRGVASDGSMFTYQNINVTVTR
ncbi:MAG: hypothetical protein GKR91_04750 [Pseudomonadales bacterium]|nr:hypothetical protein [Pseudomonadales bacterium]